MIFSETKLPGAYLIDIDRLEDERGFFARTWCAEEFNAHGLETRVVQASMSYNRRKGTLRGMHFQAPPHEEVKLVRCTRGAIWDVIIDLRPGSPTYTQHLAVDLTEQNRRALYIPAGFAHGFQTLEDHSEVFYQMSKFYEPGAGRGVRWNDPLFAIRWPIANPTILERDNSYPDFRP